MKSITFATLGNLPSGVQPDPNYDFVPPLQDSLIKSQEPPRGRQCGECGMKFDYGIGYGYHCSSHRCPMGWSR